MGSPDGKLPILFPYHSHIFKDSYPTQPRDHEKKKSNFIVPIKYVIPNSLKVSR